MGRNPLSDSSYERVAKKAKSAGSATYAGEERQRTGQGLHDLVDPAGHALVRRCLSFQEPKDGRFVLCRGTAMPIETLLDTTGSMGRNVEVAMNSLPKFYHLLAESSNAVLKRYDPQLITAIFGDYLDNYILQRSQFEFDERIAEQMTLMYPEHGGKGNNAEDPQYGLFGAAFLTDATITKLGLKGYHFLVTDEPGRQIEIDQLERVYGKEVLQRTKENGYDISSKKFPVGADEVVKDLIKRTHAFVIIVRGGLSERATSFWKGVYVSERLISLESTKGLHAVQAAIIGLTEGTLTLPNVEDFLVSSEEFSRDQALSVKKAIMHIPIGAQSNLPNFGKVPMKGAVYADKHDVWPIDGLVDSGLPVDVDLSSEEESEIFD